MKILVTGASGFLGSALVRQLILEDGADVRVLVRSSSRLDLLQDLEGRFERVEGDVTDPESLTDAMTGITQVYHVAAYIGFGGARDAENLYRVNVEGTAHVVNAALRAGVARLVQTSSMAAFGRPRTQDMMIDESLLWQDSKLNSEYAKSKYAGELEVHRAIAEGLDAVIVNPSLIFGEGRKGEGTMEIVGKVIKGLPAAPWGATNVVDVLDVAKGHRLAMAHGKTGERYFLGGENLRWTEIVAQLAEAFGKKAPSRRLHPRLALAAAYVGETIGKFTGTRPLLTLESARASMSAYQYSTEKAERELGYTFRAFRETARRLAGSGLSF